MDLEARENNMNIEEFKKDLIGLLNKHSMENGSNTPDFILGDYLVNCLLSFNSISKQREKWYGRDLSISSSIPIFTTDIPQPSTPESTLKAFETFMDKLPGTSLADLYQKEGGIPIKKRYIDEVKERDSK